MKLAKLILPMALLASASAHAELDMRADCQNPNPTTNTLADVIFVRPVGVAAMIAGSGLFVGLTPLTALASIAPPHNAFGRMGSILVVAPFSYTFKRPLGNFCR